MFRNYFAIAIRNIVRNKVHSFINIVGLALGLASFILIMLFVTDELGYEKFHLKADRIYRISPEDYVRTAPLLAPTLKSDFPEIESVARLQRYSGIMKYGDKSLYERKTFFAPQEFVNMVTLEFTQGNIEGALNNPYEAIISESVAEKYFGTKDGLGKVLIFLDTIPLKVTGVFNDLPSNTHLDFDILASFKTREIVGGSTLETWSNNIYYTYFMFHEASQVNGFEEKLSDFTGRHIRVLRNRENYSLTIQNFADIHLNSNKRMELEANSSASYVYIFSISALITLLIAGINFMNLTTARASQRAKEIGVRKSIGADKRQLVSQFLGESVITSLLSLFLALGLVYLLIPQLNSLAGKDISFLSVFEFDNLLIVLMITMALGILSGIYPAYILSSYKPTVVLKGVAISGSGKLGLRKLLVVVQFVASVMLLIGTGAVYNQLNFMKNASLGFEKEQIMVIPFLWDAKVLDQYQSLKNTFKGNSSIINVTASGDVPGRIATGMGYWAEGMPEDQYKSTTALYTDPDFIKTYKIEIIAGRDFNEEIQSDMESGYIINQSAVKEIGWTPEEAIGKRFAVHNNGTIIGVIKDFHHSSLHQNMDPLIMAIRPSWFGYISVRLSKGNPEETITYLQNTWQDIVPDRPFNYFFLDEDFNQQYQAESKFSKVLLAFSVLSIFIASMGLFGLTSYAVEVRRKEIGIRKVLGATARSILYNLSRDFTLLIVLATLIGVPVASFLMLNWMESFAYQSGINWWLVTGSLGLIFAISFLAIGFNALKASLQNPATTLRED